MFIVTEYAALIIFWSDALPPVNSYGHVRAVGSPNHTFFLGKLDKAVNQYFVHILSLVLLTTTLLESAEGNRMTLELFHNQSSRKYGAGIELGTTAVSLLTALRDPAGSE